MGVVEAMVLSAFVSAASSSHAASKQRSAAREAEEKREKAAADAEAEAARIAEDTRPEGEGVESIEFGTGGDTEIGNVSEFIRPKTAGSLGTAADSGLGGFKI